MSLNMLNMFTDKTYYSEWSGFINRGAMSKEERQVLKDMGRWFESATDNIDWNVFRGWFFTVAHPKMNEDNTKLYNTMFDKLDMYDAPDDAFAKATVTAFTTREMCGKISEVSLAGYEGDRDVDLEDIQAIVHEYELKLGAVDDVSAMFVSDDIEDLVTAITEGGLDWRHDELNKSVGRLRQGKLVCFGARPNSGKTSFIADNITYMAEQLEDDEHVVWFNNEEAGNEVKYRIIQSALGITAADIAADPARAKRQYEAQLGSWDKIIVVNKSDLSTRDVERVLNKVKAGVVVFDQLWKIHGFEKTANGDVDRIAKMFQWAREISKDYAPCITTHQADATAEGEKLLSMSQLYMGKTAIQGECDTIIMMGRCHEPGEELIRYFHVAKNKGAYGPTVDPTLGEHRYIKNLRPEVARYV